ncbi:MAG: hypothetical protein H6772_01805 [Pseudomonadales bacterium]|nr:hypothetical protein [Pseudomonadales bacterium]
MVDASKFENLYSPRSELFAALKVDTNPTEEELRAKNQFCTAIDTDEFIVASDKKNEIIELFDNILIAIKFADELKNHSGNRSSLSLIDSDENYRTAYNNIVKLKKMWDPDANQDVGLLLTCLEHAKNPVPYIDIRALANGENPQAQEANQIRRINGILDNITRFLTQPINL